MLKILVGLLIVSLALGQAYTDLNEDARRMDHTGTQDAALEQQLHPGELIHGVVDLDDWSFDKVVDGSHSVLVGFYSPNCPECLYFANEIYKLGEQFSANVDIVIGKIEISQYNKDIADRYGVSSFPTWIYFPPDNPSSYTIYDEEDKSADAIEFWLYDFAHVQKDGQLDFLNEIIPTFVKDASNRERTIIEAEQLVDSQGLEPFDKEHANYYISVMRKCVEKGMNYAGEELARLERVLEDPEIKLEKQFRIKRRHSIVEQFVFEMHTE